MGDLSDEPREFRITGTTAVPDVLRIHDDQGRLVVRVTRPPECRVEFGEGVTVEAAAERFWQAIAGFASAAWERKNGRASSGDELAQAVRRYFECFDSPHLAHEFEQAERELRAAVKDR